MIGLDSQRKTTVILALTVALLATCGRKHRDDDEPPPVQAEPALEDPANDKELRLRGHVELSTIVETSMLSTKGMFSFEDYLTSLTPLMGSYAATPVHPGWRNVTANTITTATHLLAFDELALDLYGICDNPDDAKRTAKLKPRLKTLMIKYCTTPSLTDGEYAEIWAYLTAGLVPASELQPWREEMQSIENLTAKERFEMLVTAAMASPWFIFKN